ncbi:hypothetical protein DIC66_18975 [Rhodoferax lacus]|uniref:HDOD domain-containing protein n=1 Tax=Rhodoferax lacus TaxID=2184758 RepID=A0A3E1R7H9_9BURK|nr:HDOD domain-containing protein [Rhodoferax lacus]RFO95314.1 hypothetical protein DIC66_18975 [Rhodoferax lacus]
MFAFLRRLWPAAKPPRASNPPPAAAPPPRKSRPLPERIPDPTSEFVRRESLLDRSEHIAGYTFSLFAKLHDRLSRRNGVSRRAFDLALLMRMALYDGDALLGHRLALVNLAADSLHDPVLANVPVHNTVLMLEVIQPESTDWEALVSRATALIAQGFSIGMCVQDASDLARPLLAHVDYIQVEVPRFDGLVLRELVAGLRQQRGPAGKRVRLVAHNLQSHDDFLFAHKSGFDYFHGPFVSSPVKIKAGGGINRLVVLPILNMVRADRSFALIAEKIKSEPTLTFKLLRYLKSPAMGLQGQVDNLTSALALVGRARFYRWMSLLLFDFTNPSYQERLLAERALTRGRTLELLAGKGRIPNIPDVLFLTGLFSLLDVALNLPLAELLDQAALPEPVSSTLLGQSGPMADALLLMKLGEADSAFEPQRLSQALSACGIGDHAYSLAAQQALVWANAALGDAE